jgi:hypothetical protein
MSQGKRWALLITIAFLISVGAVISIVRWVAPDMPGAEERAGIVYRVDPFLKVLIFVGIVGLIILVIKFAIKSGVREAQGQSPTDPRLSPSGALPVVMPDAEHPADGPGQYRIQGVYRQTKMDVSKYVQADSIANARVKAELEDIVVTSVQKVPL